MANALIIVVVIVVVIAVVAAAVVVLVRRSRREPVGTTEPASRPTVGDLAPMTGLESALQQVTDRAGRPIRERIDAEASHVDDLRVPDDTGPLLRRALDHVARPNPDDAAEPPPATEAAGDDEAERET